MILLHVVLAIVLLSFTGSLIKAMFDGCVSEEATIGLAFFTFFSLIAFGVSFLK